MKDKWGEFTAMNKTVSITEAKKNFSSLVLSVSKSENDAVSITVHGRKTAVLLSQEAYQELLKAKYQAEFQSIFDEFDDFNKAMRNK